MATKTRNKTKDLPVSYKCVKNDKEKHYTSVQVKLFKNDIDSIKAL